jgi:hypothetical protein
MKTLWALVLSLAAAVPAAPAQNVDWTPFSSKEFGFSMSFCGAPMRDKPSTETKGTVTATLNLFKAVTDDYMCFVALADYNIKPAVEQELKLNQDNFINAIKGKLGVSSRIQFQGLPALQFTFEMPPDLIGKAIVVIKGSRVYMLVFDYHKSKDYTSAVQKFLTSFQIVN